MPGDLSIGGGVYIYIPSAGVDYWPVTGVTEPQHYWPFSQTGDYTDQGSTGGLDLTEQGTGNSFGAGGLILNGSGWANRANNADICALGSTFSLLIEVSTTSWGSGVMGFVRSWDGSNGYATWFFNTQILNFSNGPAQFNQNNGYPVTLAGGDVAQFVVTQSGGNMNVYINTSLSTLDSCPKAMADPGASTGILEIGTTGGGAGLLNGTYKRLAILKGEAWSADDVSAIYSTLS